MHQHENSDRTQIAFHQAGHVVAAIASGITVHHCSAVTIEDVPPGVKLAPLHEVVAVALAEEAKMDLIKRYIVCRLAGPIAQMIHCANILEAMDCSISWSRWRARWKAKLLRREDIDVDFSYATIFGFCRCRNNFEINKRFNQLWKESEALLRRTDHWSQVERLAETLLEDDVLTGDEALHVIQRRPT